MSIRCDICNRPIDPREMVYCRYCKNPYHLRCIKSHLFRNKTCPHCGRMTNIAHYRRGVPENIGTRAPSVEEPRAAEVAPKPARRSAPPYEEERVVVENPQKREKGPHGGGKILFIINFIIISLLLVSAHYANTNYVEYGPILFADENIANVMPGQEVEFIVTLQNSGNIVSRYIISPDDDSVRFPAGWQILFLDFEGVVYENNRIEKALGPSEEYHFKIRISTTAGSEANSEGEFKIVAITKDGKYTSFQTFNVYTEAIYNYELHQNDAQKYVTAGGTVQFTAEIENMGNNTDTYYMRLEGLTSGWSASLLKQQATIEANRTGDIILTMTAPSSAQGNEKGEVVLKVSSQFDPEDVKTAKYTLIVNPSYGFDVTVSETSKEVLPGTSNNFTFKLRNLGNLTDTYTIVATSSLPTGWTYNLSKQSATLAREGQVTIGLTIDVPDSSPGDLDGIVNLVITSQGNQDVETIRFTVSTVVEQGKFILVELITSYNCTFCPFAEKAVEDLMDTYPGKIVVLEHHINDQLATTFTSERAVKYVFIGYPVAIIDGTKKVPGGSTNTYNEYANAIENIIDEEPLVSVNATVSDSIVNPGLKTIQTLIKSNGLPANTELDILFVTYRNGVSIGSKIYNHVSVEGYESVLTSLDNIENITVSLDIPDDGGVVIIIQDADTNKVYQAILI